MSITNDSEDWLDKILREIYDRLATEDTGIDDDYFIEDTDYKKRILAHYARQKQNYEAMFQELINKCGYEEARAIKDGVEYE